MSVDNQLILYFRESISENTFLKLTLSNYYGKETELKTVYIRIVEMKGKQLLSFVYRYKTKDITKNYSNQEAKNLLANLTKEFKTAHLFTTTNEIEFDSNNIRVHPLKQKITATHQHDNVKQGFIEPSLPFLKDLGITTESGEIKKDGYNKFKQINKFIEHLSSLFKSSQLNDKDSLRIIDFGCGKGYLTFAAYWYFTEVLHKDITLIGLDTKSDIITFLNSIAQKYAYTNLRFIEGTIETFPPEKTDIVIALHACDTATDDALAYGIKTTASIIIVAPCCHKCVRNIMQIPNEYKDILKHGILNQRQADLLTDGLRAMSLEYFGYKSSVFEFISTDHTAKNLLLTGVKQQESKDQSILEKIRTIKKTYGIKDYYLDRIIGIE